MPPLDNVPRPPHGSDMPELPEVETVCRGLAGVLEGRRLVRFETRRADLRIPFPPRLAEQVTGRTVVRVYRRAKYALLELDDGHVVIVHLGMSGRMTIQRSRTPIGRHDHVVMLTDDGTEVRLNDPRRFGLVTITPKADLDGHKLFRGLGPDPLDPTFDAAQLSAALAGRRMPIKAALLDQRIVAGLGNIYVSESLYRAGISPKRPASSVSGVRAARLVPAIKGVLRDAIAAGGSTLRDHVQPNGELGYFQHQWRVYGRAGESCPNHPGATRKPTVKRVIQSGRSTFYCPRCQT